MKLKNLWCDRMACDDSGAWMMGVNINALFYVDFSTKKYEFITDFPDVPIMAFRVNQYCMKIGDEIYLFPDFGECIWVYHLVDKKLSKIALDNPNKVRFIIGMACRCGDNIYAFSAGLEQIIEINIIKKTVTGIYSISAYIQSQKLGITRISSEVCVVNNNIYFTIPAQNLICEFSTVTKRITEFNIKYDIMAQTICYDGDDFWITGQTKEVIRWNKERNEVVSVYNMPASIGQEQFEVENEKAFENIEDIRCKNPLFRWSVKIKDKIWFIPYAANKIVCINKNTYEVNVCDMESEYADEGIWYRDNCFDCVFRERYIILYSYKRRQYLLIDTDTNIMQLVDIILEKESAERFAQKCQEKNETLIEYDKDDILDIIQHLENCSPKRKENNVGHHIWEKIR
ncbi:MAG: hypothetical protein NC321_00305 [Clostridium sp.]|nr:hypothetical protein [Clostridium sp.]